MCTLMILMTPNRWSTCIRMFTYIICCRPLLESEWEEEAEEATERKEREREVAAGMAIAREVALLEAAKIVLVERQGIATALAQEQEEVARKAAEMAEILSKEVGKTEIFF